MGFFDDIGNAFKSVGTNIVNVANTVTQSYSPQSNNAFLLSELEKIGNPTLSGLKTAGDATLSGLKTGGSVLQNIMGGAKKPQPLVEETTQQQEQPTDYSGILIIGVVGVIVWKLMR